MRRSSPSEHDPPKARGWPPATFSTPLPGSKRRHLDGILVDAATHWATAAAIEYGEAKQFVKGKEQPILAWEALFAHGPVELEAPERTVVRSSAGTESWRFYSTSSHTPGRIASCSSRRWWAPRHRQEPARVRASSTPSRKSPNRPRGIWDGRCRMERWTWALGEMVKGEAEILETDESDEAGAKLRDSIERVIGDDAEVARVEGHLRALVGLGGDGELGRDRRSEAFAAWRRYLEALAARNPLVLVFEDLHWADDGLLDFIDHLVEWASGVPPCGGHCAMELLDRRPAGPRAANTRSRCPLATLGRGDRHPRRALLEDASLTPRAESALLARAAGNPLYAGEYARMLIDRRSAGHAGAAAATSDDLPLPKTIQGITARLDALPAGKRRSCRTPPSSAGRSGQAR